MANNNKQIAETPEETPVEQVEESTQVDKPTNPPIEKPIADPEPEVMPKPESVIEKIKDEVKKVLVRCPECPWKAGLKDPNTYCPNCNGSGTVKAEPLE